MPTATERFVVTAGAAAQQRIRLERRFSAELLRSILKFQAIVKKGVISSGLLSVFVQEGLLLKREGVLPQERKEIGLQHTRVINEFANDIQSSEALYSARKDFLFRIWQAFDMGAIDAAAGLGVVMTSKRLPVKAASRDAVFELTDAELIRQLEERVIKFGVGITQKVIEDARRIIADEVFAGEAGVDIAAELIQKQTQVAEWRALKIARTEIQQSYQSARYKMHERSGVPTHSWFTVGDDRVRTEHVDNDGVSVKIGDPFPSGQLHPGDGVLSINCRCSTFPDLSNADILLEPWDGSQDFERFSVDSF